MGHQSLVFRRAGSVLCVLLVLCIGSLWAGGASSGPEDTGHIDGVPSFEPDYDSGSMALHVLQAALQAYDVDASYRKLNGVSSGAFKFVYDSARAYEPLRDACPADLLRLAACGMGFEGAHWEIDRSIEEVRGIIKAEIDEGHPLIAPYLKHDAYHGFFVVTGYDYDRDILYIQGGFGETSPDVEIPFPEAWSGPTSSPAGWADNPVFVIGEQSVVPEPQKGPDREAVEQAIEIMRGGTVAYGTHPAEGEYMSPPGPRNAPYGLPAFGVLSEDVENAPVVIEADGRKAADFAMLWRLDAQLGQLDHDRRQAWAFLQLLFWALPSEQADMLHDLAGNLEQTVEEVRRLRSIFWHVLPETVEAAPEIAQYIEASDGVVFMLPDNRSVHADLEARGLEVYQTPWGWIGVSDSPRKRMQAKTLVRSIEVRERVTLRTLEELVDHVGTRPRIGAKPGKALGRKRRAR